MTHASTDWTVNPPPPPPPVKIKPLATLALLLAFLPVLLIANQTRQLLNSNASEPVTYPCPDSYSCPTPTTISTPTPSTCPYSYSCPTPSPKPTSTPTSVPPTSTPVPPTPTPIPPTPTPITPNTNATINIYAAGTPLLGTYPTMQLRINGTIVSTWKNVRGNPNSNNFLKLSYISPHSLPAKSNIKVLYTNDNWIPGIGDRNLRIDKISVNNIDYQTENSTIYGQGAKNSRNTCSNGYLKTEWLYCNGYFSYNLP